ncbi:MAG: 4Fe-4S dicluster domain-containing protein, partial [Pseudomonadota bacterium]
MCPSYRVTRNEKDVTRGRANTLRLAMSGKLGKDALLRPEMAETMKLCVGCKACQRECPTGVDMAKMKTEVLYQRGQKLGFTLKDRLIAELPRYARLAVSLRALFVLRNKVPLVAKLAERVTGISSRRSLPVMRGDFFREGEIGGPTGADDGKGVVLFTDTFNRWMDPEIPRSALRVLKSAGYTVHAASPLRGRPLCCGRTYLSAGMIDKARAEARRTLETLLPHIKAGRPVVGLEPSCLLTMRDEFKALLPGADSEALAANALLFEEFVARETKAGRLSVPAQKGVSRAHVHGHCHQKAAGVMGDMADALGSVAGLDANMIESSCCGMAGAFGYDAETIDVSL